MNTLYTFFLYILTFLVVIYEIFLIYLLIGLIIVPILRCCSPGREKTFVRYYTCCRQIR